MAGLLPTAQDIRRAEPHLFSNALKTTRSTFGAKSGSLPLRALECSYSEGSLIQVVHFHERNSSGVVYPTHDGGVVTRREVCDDRRFARVPRSVVAVLNVLHLIAGDNSANDRMLPVVVRGNQSPGAIAQFQCRISHWIRNAILAELRADSTHDHVLWLSPLYDEPANHHVVASLHKAAGTDVAQIRRRAVELNPIEIRSPATNDRIVELKRVAAGVQNDGRLY